MKEQLQYKCQDIFWNNPQNDIVSFEFENVRYWLKKGRKTDSKWYQKFFYLVFSFDIILPVTKKTATESIEFETAKLKQLQSIGVNTPEIVLQTQEYFVLKDSGKMINSYIRKREITQKEIYYFIDMMIDTLVLLHNQNFYHGGPQARNFLYNDGKIFVIDCEESFDHSISLETLQFRDFFLFLLSLTKNRATFDLNYGYIIKRYIENSSNKNFDKKLKTLANKFSILVRLSKIKWIQKILRRDVKGFFILLTQLQKLEVEK